MKKITVISIICAFLSPTLSFASNDYLMAYRSGHYFKARNTLQTLANKNDKRAKFYLGKMYKKGHGVAKNTKKGDRLITASAKLGFQPAQIYLAKHFLHKKNLLMALVWYKKAARLGHADAQLYCGSACLPIGAKKQKRILNNAQTNGIHKRIK